jgi:hypothetical protein
MGRVQLEGRAHPLNNANSPCNSLLLYKNNIKYSGALRLPSLLPWPSLPDLLLLLTLLHLIGLFFLLYCFDTKYSSKSYPYYALKELIINTNTGDRFGQRVIKEFIQHLVITLGITYKIRLS